MDPPRCCDLEADAQTGPSQTLVSVRRTNVDYLYHELWTTQPVPGMERYAKGLLELPIDQFKTNCLTLSKKVDFGNYKNPWTIFLLRLVQNPGIEARLMKSKVFTSVEQLKEYMTKNVPRELSIYVHDGSYTQVRDQHVKDLVAQFPKIKKGQKVSIQVWKGLVRRAVEKMEQHGETYFGKRLYTKRTFQKIEDQRECVTSTFIATPLSIIEEDIECTPLTATLTIQNQVEDQTVSALERISNVIQETSIRLASKHSHAQSVDFIDTNNVIPELQEEVKNKNKSEIRCSYRTSGRDAAEANLSKLSSLEYRHQTLSSESRSAIITNHRKRKRFKKKVRRPDRLKSFSEWKRKKRKTESMPPKQHHSVKERSGIG